MKNISLIVVLVFVSISSFSQDRYIIFLKDKANTPFSLNNPSAYLTQRAIDRRTRMGINIDSLDIPVNTSYTNAIANTGARILNRSRWFNSVTVQADTNQVIAIGNLSFVQSYKKVFGTNLQKSVKQDKFMEPEITPSSQVFRGKSFGSYGGASNQTEMIKGDVLHNAGFTGKNTIIAVLDAGFTNTDIHPAFDSLRLQNRILGVWDFSKNDADVYGYSSHGTSVLSCMAAFVPDEMIGTAPYAKYYLFRTEEQATEYVVEEYNWTAAAEFADSVGVDIINSSLGYTEYDANSQSYTYADMDGQTAVITRAATLASTKGVLVVNSAGNSGNSNWRYIGAPADAEEVFSIGSVNPERNISGFSSRGPTSDQRTKPDVCAQGGPAYVASAFGGYGSSSGTSFSGPIIAGFSACAWELYKTNHPNSKPSEVKAWIKQYSDRANQIDNDYGYGIPDGSKLLLNASVQNTSTKNYKIYPNPTKDLIYIDVNNGNNRMWDIQIIDPLGKILYSDNFSTVDLMLGIQLPPNISKGFYIISLTTDKDAFKQVFIKE